MIAAQAQDAFTGDQFSWKLTSVVLQLTMPVRFHCDEHGTAVCYHSVDARYRHLTTAEVQDRLFRAWMAGGWNPVPQGDDDLEGARRALGPESVAA